MFRTTLRVVTVAVIAFTWLQGQQLTASTVAVGAITCQSTLTHFATIQAAVSAVPAGSTVLVCPGTYPEQVVISQPLNLKGVTDGTGDAAVITVPAGGLVQNATSTIVGPVAAQLLVQNTVLVTVQNLTIDGTGSGCVSGANRVFGLEFYFVGVPSDGYAGGKIQNVVVRNENGTCTIGDGIEIDNSYMTVSSNEVHDIDITPIGVVNGEVNITGNNTQNALNGIVLSGGTGANTVVSNNTISNLTQNFGFTQVGLWVNGNSATVKGNTVANAAGGYGIFLPSTSSGTTVNGNKVNIAFYGVYLTGASGTSVQSNTVSNISSDGIVDVFSAGGNNITKNTISEAPFGIFELNTDGDTLTPNSFFNVVVTIDPNNFNNSPNVSPY